MTGNKRKYRHSDVIIAAILETCLGGPCSRTKIMYGAYLSYYQASSYLHELCVETLLMEDDDAHFSITDHGRRWLSLHREQTDLQLEIAQ